MDTSCSQYSGLSEIFGELNSGPCGKKYPPLSVSVWIWVLPTDKKLFQYPALSVLDIHLQTTILN
jgi:hypothetical protein